MAQKVELFKTNIKSQNELIGTGIEPIDLGNQNMKNIRVLCVIVFCCLIIGNQNRYSWFRVPVYDT